LLLPWYVGNLQRWLLDRAIHDAAMSDPPSESFNLLVQLPNLLDKICIPVYFRLQELVVMLKRLPPFLPLPGGNKPLHFF
jgi:hypothetical protein